MSQITDPALNWRLRWNGHRDIWSTAGEFYTRRELENAQKQLARMKPHAEFKIEFIGRGISHNNDGAAQRSKF